MLTTVAGALLPLTISDSVVDALLTGPLNTAIGISVTTLLLAVAARTGR